MTENCREFFADFQLAISDDIGLVYGDSLSQANR
jgi:hypothetical protein